MVVYNLRISPLQAGTAPRRFAAENFQLSKHRGKNVVVLFSPKPTPRAAPRTCEFRDASPQFAKKNTEIIGVSPDQAEPQQKWAPLIDCASP